MIRNPIWGVVISKIYDGPTTVLLSHKKSCDREYNPGPSNLRRLAELLEEHQDEIAFEFTFRKNSVWIDATVPERRDWGE